VEDFKKLSVRVFNKLRSDDMKNKLLTFVLFLILIAIEVYVVFGFVFPIDTIQIYAARVDTDLGEEASVVTADVTVDGDKLDDEHYADAVADGAIDDGDEEEGNRVNTSLNIDIDAAVVNMREGVGFPTDLPDEVDENIVFVGDSRMVQTEILAGESNPYSWVAESGQGYVWFSNTAIYRVDSIIEELKDPIIIVNMGINDLENVDRYIEIMNQKAAEWQEAGATVAYVSVNPIDNYGSLSNSDVVEFNKILFEGLDDDIYLIDTVSYLNRVGYGTTDGLHYDNETYIKLYRYYLYCASIIALSEE